MFAQSTPAFPIVAVMAYLLSLLWVVGTQVIALRRVDPVRGRLDRAGVVLMGEVLALVPGGILLAGLMEATRQVLATSGVSSELQNVLLVNDILHPLGAGTMLLVWLATWGALASVLKALLLKASWKITPVPWGLAFRLSAHAYLGTAVATVALVVAFRFG